MRNFVIISEKESEIRYRRKISRLKRKYGLNTKQIFKVMTTNNCDICGEDCVINIDHDHKTGKVRGILCKSCNTALGLVKDNTEILQKMIDYLKEHQ